MIEFNNRLRKMNMRAKILLAPALIIAFLLLFGFASYLGLTTQKRALQDIYGTRFKSYQTSAVLVKDLTSVHANTYRILGWEAANYDQAKIDALSKEQLLVLDRAVETVKKGSQRTDGNAGRKKDVSGHPCQPAGVSKGDLVGNRSRFIGRELCNDVHGNRGRKIPFA